MAVVNRIAEFHEQMMGWRQLLHQSPELAFEEKETSNFVAARLAEFGVEVIRGFAGTGVVGKLNGRRQSPHAIGLRADMDGLPIHEATGLEYSSRTPGKMHACGHDGHTAMLLGAARYLAESRNFAGTIYFIFQPAEEQGGGAAVMIKDGLLRDCPMQEVFGLHNWPGLPEGMFAIRSGAVTAACDQFDMVVAGAGSHAAMPHDGHDPITVAAAIISSLQLIVSRRTAPTQAAVVSVTQFHAGDTHNVIPGEARLCGTLRSLNEEAREHLREDLRRTAEGVAGAHGLTATVTVTDGYPAAINTDAESALALHVASEIAGESQVVADHPPGMGCEDFAFMLQKRPGAYVLLGNGSASEGRALHSPRYDFNDAILPVGASYWARLAEMRLASS